MPPSSPPADCFPAGSDEPTVLFFGDAAGSLEATQLALTCRFYGLQLVVIAPSNLPLPLFAAAIPDEALPILVVVHASALAHLPASICNILPVSTGRHNLPIAVVGITSDTDVEKLAQLVGVTAIRTTPADPNSGLWVSAPDPASTGFELRGLRFPLGPAHSLDFPSDVTARTLASLDASGSQPVLACLEQNETTWYLAARTAALDSGGPEQLRHTRFGEIAPLFLLMRDVGGDRCWHPPAALANLTIDDPWLTEPYGCLSFPGLLAEMKRERFHTTIGFVPWNFDRNHADVIELIRNNPGHYSIAVHGNNHDHYEFFRYEGLPGDKQAPKPLAVQAYNVRQAMARMEKFQELTGIVFDRVMVFPHGVCPSATFEILKQRGFWATFNYSNVPLGASAPADPAVAGRGVNAEWYGFPAVRRAYPEKYPEEAIAIDLFLGNPVIFMSHQDMFFDGINAFTPPARKVNTRQPAVQWKSLGEISRHLHLLRWRDDRRCDVRLFSCHAKIENSRSVTAEFRFAKHEPAAAFVARVTLDGAEMPWMALNHDICFTATFPPGAKRLVEIHYLPPVDANTVPLGRKGLGNRILRLISDFRDLTLARSAAGKFLTRHYYRGGKKRLTIGGLVSKVTGLLRLPAKRS